jgi:hypothetical protein
MSNDDQGLKCKELVCLLEDACRADTMRDVVTSAPGDTMFWHYKSDDEQGWDSGVCNYDGQC